MPARLETELAKSLQRFTRAFLDRGIALVGFCASIPVSAQSPSPAWPFPPRSPGAVAVASPAPPPRSTPPLYDVPLRQERSEQLPNREISAAGEKAFALRPKQWRHGETENFIIHYRTMGDALQVAREIEFDLWYVAHSLGSTKDQYARKSHVYVFRDGKEWQQFLSEIQAPEWVRSFAARDDLYLALEAAEGGFDSHTLAHETTHAVVARIYGNRRWPLWLSEGFAEYMGDASVAARHSRSPRSNQRKLNFAGMSVAELLQSARYPDSPLEVARLYDTSAKFVRYLFNKYPKELFPKFVERQLNGAPAAEALVKVYGPEFSDLPEFEKRFSRFTR